MKKILLTITCGLFVLGSFAQNGFKILQPSKTDPSVNTDVTGTSIIFEGSSELNMDNGDEPMKVILNIVNNDGAPIKTLVKRSYQNNLGSTNNQFCWEMCYAITTALSPDTITINGGDTLKNTFYTHFWANGNEGDYTIRYTFFEADNESNENYVDITYRAKKTVSIKNNEAAVSVKVYPNPATDFINIEYNALEDGKISLFDITGKKITEQVLKASNKISQLEISQLNSGIYFYTVVSNNKTIATKKIVKQ